MHSIVLLMHSQVKVPSGLPSCKLCITSASVVMHPACLLSHISHAVDVSQTCVCLNRSQTPSPEPSGQGPVNYAPANIWGSAMAAHQAAAGGAHTPNPTPSTSTFQTPPSPQHSYPPQQPQQHKQQQPSADPSAAVIKVWR